MGDAAAVDTICGDLPGVVDALGGYDCPSREGRNQVIQILHIFTVRDEPVLFS